MKTLHDIKTLIEQKKLNVLQAFVDEYIQNKVKNNFDKQVEEEYKEIYSNIKVEEIKNVLGDIIRTEKELPVIEYDDITTDVLNNEVKHYVTKTITVDGKEINVLDEEGNLTEEVKTLIEKGEVLERPTFEYFKSQKELPTVTDKDYADEELAELILQQAIPVSADIALQKAREYLAQKRNVTYEQIERYRVKYQTALAAKNGDTDAKNKLALEAGLMGQDVDAYIDLIIELGQNWQKEIEGFIIKIEAVRVAVQKLVNVKIEKDTEGNIITPETELAQMGVNLRKAVEIISKGSQLPASVTNEEIKALFA
jgi:predicted transcriptional regulator